MAEAALTARTAAFLLILCGNALFLVFNLNAYRDWLKAGRDARENVSPLG